MSIVLFAIGGMTLWLIQTLKRILALRNGAFFAPTSQKNINTIIAITQKIPHRRIIDLGSGDGRILCAFAEKGFSITGIEYDPTLIHLSRKHIAHCNYKDRITLIEGDLWKHSLKPYDVVIVFGIGHIMKRLEQKLQHELPAGAFVLSNHFTLPTWKHKMKRGDILIYQKL